MTAPPPGAPWTTELVYRLRHLFLLKLFGTTAVTTLFFVVYFQLLRHPAYPVSTMPLTALDALVAFRPEALFPYLSLWVYVGVGPGVQRDFRQLVSCGLWMAVMCAAGLGIFYFWPTAVPPAAIDTSGFFGFRLLQGVDAAGNACPSMHVAAAMFTVIRIAHVLRVIGAPIALRTVNLAWFAAIAWSTLATRQHVVLDVAGGAVLGALFALCSLWWKPAALGISSISRPPKKENTP